MYQDEEPDKEPDDEEPDEEPDDEESDEEPDDEESDEESDDELDEESDEEPDEKPKPKVFTTTRLKSGLGYREIPPVDGSFRFRLPSFTAFRSRVVTVQGERYLIWSPNSSQDPFYPGVFPQLEPPPLPSSLKQRRYDGHRGPSDFTRSPQVYDPARPWLGFILRETQRTFDEVEYNPAYSVWIPSIRQSQPPGVGTIDPYFLTDLKRRCNVLQREATELVRRVAVRKPGLLARRPVLLSPDLAFSRLECMTKFDEVVDSLTEITRVLREMGAWNRFAGLWARDPMCPPILEGIPSADDRFLGVWINGADEADCLVLLRRARVPCFIIHRMEPGEQTQAPVFKSFVAGTELDRVILPQSCNAYDKAVTRDPKFTEKEAKPVARAVIIRSTSPTPRASLHWQLDLLPSEILPALCLRPSDWTDRNEFDRQRDGKQRLVVLAHAARPPEASRSPADASAWTPPPTPPPVQGPYLQEWTTFEEDVDFDEEDLCMRQVGQNSKSDREVGEDEEIFYDRKLGRRLIFINLPADDRTPSLATSPEFGRPVPPWPFLSDNKKKKVVRPSKWMYAEKAPKPDTIGSQPRSAVEAPLPPLALEAPQSNRRSEQETTMPLVLQPPSPLEAPPLLAPSLALDEQAETTTPLVLPTVTQQGKSDDEVSLGPSGDEAFGAVGIAPVAAVGIAPVATVTSSVASVPLRANSPGWWALSNCQDQSERAIGGRGGSCRGEENRGPFNAARSPSVEPSSSAKAPEATRVETRAPPAREVEGQRPSAPLNAAPPELTLLERLGQMKKKRHRPHNRPGKRLKMEAEMNAG